jgi:hypothetical protein
MGEKMNQSLSGAILYAHRAYWLVEYATDLEIANRAMLEAAVTGSIGSTSTEGEYNKPPKREAKVHRLDSLNFVLASVYGENPKDHGSWVVGTKEPATVTKVTR